MTKELLKMIKVSILGITGYAGIELFRLLKQHSQVEIINLVSNSKAGQRLEDVYPQFTDLGGEILKEYNKEEIAKSSDIVFLALPHGISQDRVAELYNLGLKVIDLSGDYRYQEKDEYETWYGLEHKYPQLLKKAVYGLVELKRKEIKKASLIANPGCYPTASLLGLLPLTKDKLLKKDSIIIDAKSGVSGAGRSLKQATHFTEVDESIKAYNITTHRHTSEIEGVLGEVLLEKKLQVNFTPHLVPMKRGILATIYVELQENIAENELIDLYTNYYKNDYFVKILSDNHLPETKYVTGTNFCHLALKLDSRTKRLIIISAIDNLAKGAAGQAVQNMNVMFGLDEKIGLMATGVFP